MSDSFGARFGVRIGDSIHLPSKAGPLVLRVGASIAGMAGSSGSLLLDERTFSMASIAYTGSVFPSPEQNWLSRLADEKNTNNITGFKNARADEIID